MDSLHQQGQQLNNIENNLDNINQDLKKADKALVSMETGCLGGMFRERIIIIYSKESNLDCMLNKHCLYHLILKI